MIKIAVCLPHKADSDYVIYELKRCLSVRNAAASIVSFPISCHSFHQDLLDFLPDILITHINTNDRYTLPLVLKLKRYNPSMVSLFNGNTDFATLDQHILLHPFYQIDLLDRKVLWEYAHMAYALSIQNSLSFTYYRRPNYVSIPLDHILYFVSEGRRIHIISTDSDNIFYDKLDDVELIIQQKSGQFVRIHKSYLVNTRFVKEYSRKFLKLHTGELLSISTYDRYLALSEACHQHAASIYVCPSLNG